MQITVMAKKGGVGKSTVSLMLNEAFLQAGRSARVHDWDAQGTSSKALALINGKKTATGPEADIIIFDTLPSLDHTATKTAVRDANIVLIVTTTAPADIWEAEEAVQFAQANNNAKAKIRVVFNKVRKTTLLGRLAAQSGKQTTAPSLPVMLSERECYKHAIGQGWKALDAAAREEVLQFAVALLSME